MNRTPLRILTAAILALPLAAGASAPASAAAKSKPCTRGGAAIEVAGGDVVVVRMKAKRRSSHETRREHLLACWRATGRRIVVAREVDHGLDNRASTVIEVVQERYVGVRERNEGGVSESIRARVYDARKGRLLHSSAACDKVDQGDFSGVSDIAFLDGGGMAMVCRGLFLFRRAGSAMETLEPAGTDVRQVAVTRLSHFFIPRLFWSVGDGGTGEVAKSLQL